MSKISKAKAWSKKERLLLRYDHKLHLVLEAIKFCKRNYSLAICGVGLLANNHLNSWNSTARIYFHSWVVIIIENLDEKEIQPANCCNVMHARYVGMSVAINLHKIILCVGSTDQYNLFHYPIWRHKEVIIALCRGAVHICIKQTTLKNSLSSTNSFEGIVHKAG